MILCCFLWFLAVPGGFRLSLAVFRGSNKVMFIFVDSRVFLVIVGGSWYFFVGFFWFLTALSVFFGS